jgi:AraC-like DNA-binding protein
MEPMNSIDNELISDNNVQEKSSETPSNKKDNKQIKPPPSSKRYQNSPLTEEDSQNIFEAVHSQIELKSLFLDPKLSLSSLAKLTGFKTHYISQAINQNTQGNFFDFINEFRIVLSKKLLSENLNETVNILDVAMKVGFNSKSSFYTSFKKHTSQTPTQYRKTIQLSN